MTKPTISQMVQRVLAVATEPMTAKGIAAALPHYPAPSVVATVSELARTRKINRVHHGSGILRYSASNGAVTEPAAAPEVARTFRPESIASPVAELPATAAQSSPGQHKQAEDDARFMTLQGKVRAVVEGQPTQRWTVEAIERALKARWPELSISAISSARSRLGNLTRAGNASPLRRMPDGSWMVNTPENRERAEREAKAIQAIHDNAIDIPAGACVGVVVGVPAAVAALDRKPPHKPTTTAERIERAERHALRALISAVVAHIDQPPEPVIRALSRGLETLGRQAA